MTVRIYLPTTLAVLAVAHADSSVEVTEQVVVAEGDGEEEEYAALMTAADASTALLTAAGRRVVVVAEVPEPPATGDRIPWRRVVAVHADVRDRAVAADPDEDLGWFATQEVADLLAETGPDADG